MGVGGLWGALRAPRALPPVPDAFARAPRGWRASSSRTLSPRPSGPPQVRFVGDGRRESSLQYRESSLQYRAAVVRAEVVADGRGEHAPSARR